MTRQIFIISIILIGLLGCDFSKNVKDRVDNGVKDAKVEMESDISRSKSEFEKSYGKIVQHSKDSVFLIKVTDLYSSITKTSKYIDSLRIEMDKLDALDTKNIELLKQMYLYNGIGDSVFNKVKRSYSITIDIAIADTTKLRLRKAQEIFSKETEKQFFELNSSLGINMILYGIESELIKDGSRCLTGHESI